MHPQVHAAGLLQLPEELLLDIFEDLNNYSLYQLAMTCRRLHFFALSLIFNRYTMDPARGIIALNGEAMTALPALRISLSFSCLTYLHCEFDSDGVVLLRQVHNVSCLISRLSSVTEVSLTLPYVDFQTPKNRIDLGKWIPGFLDLLNTIIDSDKSCKTLSVYGGQNIITGHPAIIHHPTPTTGSPQNDERPANDDPTVHAGPEPDSRNRGRSIFVFPSLQKMLKKFVLRKQLKSLPVTHAKDDPCPESKSADNAITPAHLSLQTVNIFSDALFHSPFYDWTVNTLNAAQITNLSFGSTYWFAVPWAQVWARVLPSLTLPVLCSLSVGDSRIEFVDLSNFLTRHPSITTLDLRNMLPPPPQPHHLVNIIIPKLNKLIANPPYLLPLLESNIFPDLDSIDIVSHWRRPVDFTAIDAVLAIAARLTPRIVISLISFPIKSSLEFEEWLMGLVSGASDAVLDSLRCVTRLEITGSQGTKFSSVTIDHFPQWIALFPSLKYVSFFSTDLFEKAAVPAIIQSVQEACPQIHSVYISP